MSMYSCDNPSRVQNYPQPGYRQKKAHDRFRWNLLWQVFVLLGFYPFLAFWGRASIGVHATTVMLGVLNALFFTIGAISCWRYIGKMRRATEVDWSAMATEKYGQSAVAGIQQIFVLPAFKEPLDLLENTIQTVANQTVANTIVMVVSLEEKAPMHAETRAKLELKFGQSFSRFIVTMHPKGLEGEILGACSNRKWGVRRSLQILEEEHGFKGDDNTLITVCDSDTVFHESYAECLVHGFLSDPDRLDICYQSPLFYNMGLDTSYFFTRVIAILRSFLMVGFLIPMNINTMSIYSIPLALLKKSNFFHPGYQMDDIIFTLSAMQAIGKHVSIRQIDVPALSGPTCGETLGEEFAEWVKQAKRWTIGSAEVLHYFVVKWLAQILHLCGLELRFLADLLLRLCAVCFWHCVDVAHCC